VIDFYVALFAPRQSPHSLAWSALPHAPVLPDEGPGGAGGWLRRRSRRSARGAATSARQARTTRR
jgi:hypothetical protein